MGATVAAIVPRSPHNRFNNSWASLVLGGDGGNRKKTVRRVELESARPKRFVFLAVEKLEVRLPLWI